MPYDEHLIPDHVLEPAAQAARERWDNPDGIDPMALPPAARPVPWDALPPHSKARWMSRVAPAVVAALNAINPDLIGQLSRQTWPVSRKPDEANTVR